MPSHIPRSDEILYEHAKEMLLHGITFGSGPISMFELVRMSEMVMEEPCLACGEQGTLLIPYEGSFICPECLGM